MTSEELESFFQAARRVLLAPADAPPDLLARLELMRDGATLYSALVDSVRDVWPNRDVGAVEDWRGITWGIARLNGMQHDVAVVARPEGGEVACVVKSIVDAHAGEAEPGVLVILDESEASLDPACAHLFDSALRDDGAIAMLDDIGERSGAVRGQA